MEQIRLRTLLKEDELFRVWFMKPPTLTALVHTPPWRIYIQAEQGGRWARGDIPSYAKAVAQINSRLRDAWDMTIHCKPQQFKPPVVRKKGHTFWLPLPEGHEWCSLCRRAVIFNTFNKHPALKFGCDSTVPRCTICGMKQESMRRFPSELRWPAKLAAK